MNNILPIRQLLGMSQVEFGLAIGVSQGNVSHYEQGRQEVPPDVARRLISAAKEYPELRGDLCRHCRVAIQAEE